jgi:hypothetical protein
VFTNGSRDYLLLESLFGATYFLFIDQSCSYHVDIEHGVALHAFLCKMDNREVKWLLYIPATAFVKELFNDYHQVIQTFQPTCIAQWEIGFNLNISN